MEIQDEHNMRMQSEDQEVFGKNILCISMKGIYKGYKDIKMKIMLRGEEQIPYPITRKPTNEIQIYF
jgi:hypothetical protein